MNSARAFESGSSPLRSDKSPRQQTPKALVTSSPQKSQQFSEFNEEKPSANIQKKIIVGKGKGAQELDVISSEIKKGHQSLAMNENNNNDSYISSVGDSFESNQNIAS